MAIEQGIWKVPDIRDGAPQKVVPAKINDESFLEDLITKDIAILNQNWLLIGRQIRTSYDKIIDLLAIDANGSIIIIELKRDKTPREIVAQTLDYASWIVALEDYNFSDIYQKSAEKYCFQTSTLDKAFESKFGIPLDSSTLNQSHELVIVATQLDSSSERIINYLNDYAKIPINALFFQVFEDNGNKYLSRAWMIDPEEPTKINVSKQAKGLWNNEFYVSFGDDRPWNLAKKMGFVAGGGGEWYSKTLSMLTEGDRVWVNIPGQGYVGVGYVIGERCLASEYEFVGVDGNVVTLPEIVSASEYPQINRPTELNGEDTQEYLVPVKWIYTVDKGIPFRETGLFGNQNTVCKPRSTKWEHTVDRLKHEWKIDED